jgi:hypothetical protein
MDPNTTQSLKEPVAANDLCQRPWKKPNPLPLEVITIQRHHEPEFVITVPTDMINRDQTGVSWSLYCQSAFATVTLEGAPSFIELRDNQVIINPFKGSDSGWHTFRIIQKNPRYPFMD